MPENEALTSVVKRFVDWIDDQINHGEQPAGEVLLSLVSPWQNAFEACLNNKPETIKPTNRETATILAALRVYQRDVGEYGAEIDDIATDSGAFEAMLPEEIDELCGRLNCGDDTGPQCCPFCRSTDLALNVEENGIWFDPDAPDNTMTLSEGQCHACGRSFWS